MATKKKSEPQIMLEREYNIPLRRKYLLVPKYKRAKKCINTIFEFLSKHMKSDQIKLGNYLNLEIWKDGIKSPPHHVAVIAKKYDDGVVKVELKGAPEKVKKEKEVKNKKPSDDKAKSEVKPSDDKAKPEVKPSDDKAKSEVKPSDDKAKSEVKPSDDKAN
jgi:large subunit ribosomal protein L31e